MINTVRNAVDGEIKFYNPKEELIKKHQVPNYHSYLKPGDYHFINDSVMLAAAIFSCGYEKYYDMAKAMLNKAVSLQCKEGEISGLWSYYLEEALDEMVEPDWNYADFNAYPLLYILKEHGDKLGNTLYKNIADACVLACESMIRRNLDVGYTNPAVMNIYCTVACGQILGIEKLLEYGREKLQRFHTYIMNMGTYDEYNCPGYNILIINLYSIMLRHFEDENMIAQTHDLNRLAWTMLGEHYHFEIGEFSGPNFRQYENFWSKESNVNDLLIGDFVQKRGRDPRLLRLVYKTECPDDIKRLFLQENKSCDFRRIIPVGKLPKVDTQHIRPRYTLGSVSMLDGWNQRRNVVSYIGNKDKKVCIRLRAYHDGYDFSSAYILTAQEASTAISLTNFLTNAGDTHITLDMVKNATIKATDLSVVYQIEANCDGIIDEIKVEKTENGCNLEIIGVPVEITFPFMEITGYEPRVEISSNDKEMLVSAALYLGEETEINLSELDSLAVVSVLSVGEKEIGIPQIEKDNNILSTKIYANGKLLNVKGTYKPMKGKEASQFYEVLVDGIDIDKTVN